MDFLHKTEPIYGSYYYDMWVIEIWSSPNVLISWLENKYAVDEGDHIDRSGPN